MWYPTSNVSLHYLVKYLFKKSPGEYPLWVFHNTLSTGFFFIKTPFGKGSTRVSEIVRGFMYQRTIDLQQNEKEFQY